MKKLLALALLVAGTMTIVSCGSDDDPAPVVTRTSQGVLDSLASALASSLTSGTATGSNADFSWTDGLDGASRTAPTEDTVVVDANITGTVNWTADRVYKLTQRITVLDGATLNIAAGTVIAGQAGNAPENAAALMVAQGGTLNANGTAADPIVFTSTVDNGIAVTAENTGLWGGLVILGEARISDSQETAQIEGVPGDDPNGVYGGTNDADNSGTITYVSIRHGGSEIFGGSEINGLTLGGVGTGTTISNIHIYANADDGIEFFGGSVDASNLYVELVDDDALDVDQAYSGTIDNWVVDVDASSDEALEIDGREGTLDRPFTLSNGTVNAIGGATITSEFKAQAKATVTNVDHKGAVIKLLASFGDDDLTLEEDAATNAAAGALTFATTNATWELVAELSDESVIRSTVQ